MEADQFSDCHLPFREACTPKQELSEKSYSKKWQLSVNVTTYFILLVKKSDFMDRCAFEEGWLGNSEYDVVHNPRSWAQLLKVKIVL